ncbi:MAG: hypothetical protein M5U26_06325 [Planctomycetota bacterium]|nr:hypothetical protein [Planctomycetota bacterium]
MYTPFRLSGLAALLLAAASFAAEETKLVNDFEDDGAFRGWDFKKKSNELAEEHATHGKKSLKLAPDEYMVYWAPQDWAGYDALVLDIFVDGEAPVGVTLLIADKDWDKNGKKYWDRHNGGFNLKPGANTVSIPVGGLFRGEAGSRNNNLKYNIKPDEILRLDLGFKPSGAAKALYLDHFRLVKESRPEGILAFDFGPESQTVFPGFTPISWNTVHGENGNKAGLLKKGYAPSQARDDTFPTRLYQDFVELGGHEFVADVPNGAWHGWAVFDDCGYWGGETCHHTKRWIEAEGQQAWVDDRGPDGPSDYLYRFEKIEPRPGDSLWELYMKDLFLPRRFSAEVKDGKLNLKLGADAGWSCKLAGLILYPDAKKAEAEVWIAEIEKRNREEFESRALYVGPKNGSLQPPEEAVKAGWWLGYPGLEETIHLTDAPGKADGKLERVAALGQRVSFTFAVRPLKDFAGEIALSASDLKGPGILPAAEVDLRCVRHGTSRSFNSIAYTIEPHLLVPVAGSGVQLTQDLTRQFWVTVRVPEDAKPGRYQGSLALNAGALKLDLPFAVDVVNLKLDEPDYAMGFYGFHVPGSLPEARRAEARLGLFRLLRESGMTTFTGGPGIPFKGLDAAGKPILDFTAIDPFLRDAKAAGFTGPLSCYGGPGMVTGLHDGYTIGKTGREWAQKTGKSFPELLGIVWGAVRDHAKAEGWPEILIGLNDEPRTIDSANAQLELYKAYAEGAPWVRTGGSYSVHWEGRDELSKIIQEHFMALQWSALNSHKQIDLDKAKEFKKEMYIYNQGTNRYSFGAYQWAEFHKGVRGRFQWHLLALHGYQFFDLDGREPDTAMIHWGREGAIPTIHLPRCREGADDFRFAVTLWNAASKKKGAPAADAALAWLEDISSQIPAGANKRPKGFMDDEAFRAACLEHLKKLTP